ncbi:MAG TPA: mechanosensitive ion channel domain-containing protein [Blastocatellia bacterium]|nr:mechanosensitive ion channel domain-containing protein [Blastocatellia bacterium]
MILQDQPSAPSFGDSLLERIIRILNHEFITQGGLKVSIISLILLVLVISIAALVSRYARRFLDKRVLPRVHMEPGLRYTLLMLVHYVIIVFGVLYGLKLGLSVDLTGVAVILGFLSVGIGFGLQYVAADIVSGFILLFERPVRVGDRLRLKDGIEGRVQNISIRSTIVVTNENMAVIVPNSKLVQNELINYSYPSQNVRLNVPVGVAYGSDLEKVSQALVEAARSVDEVLATPEPRVHFSGFGDSALNLEIRVWINEPHKHPQIRSNVNFAIDRVFRERNIEIPFPQRDVRLRTAPININEEASGKASDDDG